MKEGGYDDTIKTIKKDIVEIGRKKIMFRDGK
jgi:hypothetical protein